MLAPLTEIPWKHTQYYSACPSLKLCRRDIYLGAQDTVPSIFILLNFKLCWCSECQVRGRSVSQDMHSLLLDRGGQFSAPRGWHSCQLWTRGYCSNLFLQLQTAFERDLLVIRHNRVESVRTSRVCSCAADHAAWWRQGRCLQIEVNILNGSHVSNYL